MAFSGRRRPKGGPVSGFSYIKGEAGDRFCKLRCMEGNWSTLTSERTFLLAMLVVLY